jgi:AraC-like DNA-binding protein
LAIQHYVHPRLPLSAFVEILWSYESDPPAHTDPLAPPKERRLPDGSMTVMINLRDDLMRIYDQQHPDQFQSYRGCIISGAHSTFTIIDTTSQAAMLGIEFKPGGARPFFAVPLAELQNQVIALEMVWGAQARRLRERLLDAATPEHRFALLEQALLARLAPARISHPAVSSALRAFQHLPHVPPIAAVAEGIGLSQTRFIHVFRDAVGLTPKQFCRVLRFQQVLRLLESGAPVKWVELALSCGYFDQAHFIHDFQAFAGLTPSTYLALRGEHRNHVPLVE